MKTYSTMTWPLLLCGGRTSVRLEHWFYGSDWFEVTADELFDRCTNLVVVQSGNQ